MTNDIRDAVRLAHAQVGLPYIFGYEESPTDPTPEAFDCSELMQYIDQRVGPGTMPDGSMNQLAYCQARNLMIPVEKALKIRGAIVFRHISVTGVGHVAISRGTTKPTTVEARGSAYGVGVFDADPRTRLWTHGAYWPGFDYEADEPDPKMVKRWVVFGPYGGRWGHGRSLDDIVPVIQRFNDRFPWRPAMVMRRTEPANLDKLNLNDFPQWLAKRNERKGR